MTGPTDLYRLTAELRELGRGFETAAATLAEPVTGTDDAGAVMVSLDAAGRVSAVRPSTRWRDLVAADQFGDAVVEAAQAAQVNRLDRWSAALDEQPLPGDAGRAVELDADESAAEPAVDLAALRADSPYIDLLALMDEATATLDQVIAAAADPTPSARDAHVAHRVGDADEASDAPVTIGSRDVSVHLDGAAAVIRVDVELRWLAGADRGRLADALGDAFTRAYAAYDARSVDGVDGTAGQLLGSVALSPQFADVARNPAGALAAFAHHL